LLKIDALADALLSFFFPALLCGEMFRGQTRTSQMNPKKDSDGREQVQSRSEKPIFSK